MMEVLIDTWGWISLFNKKEKRHEDVTNWYRDFRVRRGIVYSTDYIDHITYLEGGFQKRLS